MGLFQIISKLTLRRVSTIFLAELGYRISGILKKPVILSLPWAVSMEPSSLCNLQCPECPAGMKSLKREKGLLTIENFNQWIAQIRKHTSMLTLYFQGEPLLNSELPAMIRTASDAGLYTILSTNAQLLDKIMAQKMVSSGLSKLIISMDGSTQESYGKYRKNGLLEKVKDGINNLKEAREKAHRKMPMLILQFIVFSHNEHEIKTIKKLSKELGVDRLELKTAQHYHLDQDSSMLTNLEKYRRYRKDSKGSWILKKKITNQCARLWHTAVISWDGQVVPCCYDKDAVHGMGSLKNENFQEIWYGEAYRNFRKKVLQRKQDIAICCNCTG